MSTSPKEIQAEYPVFRKINLTLIILVVVLLGINIIFFMLNIIK
jgi:CHASE3 domain sensor protein